jgi:hypothetical protein
MVVVGRHGMRCVALVWGCVLLCVLPTDVVAAEDADNAALLYYQAFIRCPNYDELSSEVIGDVVASAISIADVDRHKAYIEKNKEVIQLVEAGSQKSRCNWAIPPLQAVSFETFTVRGAKTILFLVGADARALAAGGDYRRALERILTLRRFAVHLTHDPNLRVEGKRGASYGPCPGCYASRERSADLVEESICLRANRLRGADELPPGQLQGRPPLASDRYQSASVDTEVCSDNKYHSV